MIFHLDKMFLTLIQAAVEMGVTPKLFILQRRSHKCVAQSYLLPTGIWRHRSHATESDWSSQQTMSTINSCLSSCSAFFNSQFRHSGSHSLCHSTNFFYLKMETTVPLFIVTNYKYTRFNNVTCALLFLPYI